MTRPSPVLLLLVTFSMACDKEELSADWGGSDDAAEPADPFGTGGDDASDEPSGEVDSDVGPGSTGSGGGPGDDCEGGGVLDCASACWVAEARGYIGDGTCDVGQRGPDFDCAEIDFDGGDCQTTDVEGESGSDGGAASAGTTGPDDTGGTTGSSTTGDGSSSGGSSSGGSSSGGTSSGGSSGAGTDGGPPGGGPPEGDGPPEPGLLCGDEAFFDCDLECLPIDPFYTWLGDGYCDEMEAANLNCAELEFDYGDCVDAPDPDEDGEGDEHLGGCIIDGVCSDGLAMGECTGFGGVWVADGCPATLGECWDFEYIPGTATTVDPSDSVYEDDLSPSCNGSPSRDVTYFWTPPSTREYCITATVNVAYEATFISPVVSVWNVDCETELHCSHGDFTDDAPMAQIRAVFGADEPYAISLEHDLSTEIGLFDLTIEPCAE